MSSSDSSFSVRTSVSILSRDHGAHSDVVRTLNLGLLLGRLSGTAGRGSTASGRGSSGTTAGADVGKKVLHVLALKRL